MIKQEFETYLFRRLNKWQTNLKTIHDIHQAIEQNDFICTVASLLIKSYVDNLSENHLIRLCKEFEISEMARIDLEIALIDRYVIQHNGM
jgi:hypothetical protein